MNLENSKGLHHGQVIAEYRKKANWTQEELARALKQHPRTVQRLEENPMIKSMGRRRFLAGLLGIPVALLGLEIIAEKPTPKPKQITHDRMTYFEDELAMRWEMYFTGGTARAALGLNFWINEIVSVARSLSATPLHQRTLAILTMSYQLQNCIYRDNLDFPNAHRAFKNALSVAEELGSEEYYAAALARQGVTFIQENNPQKAITCLTRASEIIHYKGLPGLKGHILQAFAEAQAMTRNELASWHALSLAEHLLDQQPVSPERSLARFNGASIIAHRGIVAAKLKDHHYAVSLIDKSLKSYDPSMIRGRARMLAQKAEAFYHATLIDETVSTAEEALLLARSVRSNRTITLVEEINTALQDSRWNKEISVARLNAIIHSTPTN